MPARKSPSNHLPLQEWKSKMQHVFVLIEQMRRETEYHIPINTQQQDRQYQLQGPFKAEDEEIYMMYKGEPLYTKSEDGTIKICSYGDLEDSYAVQHEELTEWWTGDRNRAIGQMCD